MSWLFVCGMIWLFAAPVLPAFGSQEHALSDPSAGNTPDLVHIRTSLTINAASNEVHGDVRAEVHFTSSNGRIISFSRPGTIYTDVRIIADGSPSLVYLSDSLAVDEPIHLPDSIQAASFFVSWHYSSRSTFQTFPLGSASGEWTSIISRPDAQHSLIGGLEVEASDTFIADSRVVLPSDWHILTAPDSASTTVLSSSETLMAHIMTSSPEVRQSDMALLAFSNENPSFKLTVIEDDSLFAAQYSHSRQFFERFAGPLHQPRYRFATPGLADPTPLSSDIELIPDLTLLEPPISESRFFLAATLAASDLTRNVRILGRQGDLERDDTWLVDAFESFLIAELLGERSGADDRASYMSRLRHQYLSDPNASFGSLSDLPGSSTELGREARRAKGTWIMQMLSDEVGPDIFQSALIDFLTGQSDDTPHSSDYFRQLLEEKSGRSFETFFSSWVAGAGHPVFTYTYAVRSSQDAIDVRVQQVQVSADGQQSTSIAFPVSTTLAVYSIGGAKQTRVNLRTADASVTIPIDLRPQSILLDPAGRSLFETSSDLGADHFITPLRRATTNEERLSILNQIADWPIESSHLLGVRPLLTQPISEDVHARLIQLIGRAAPSTSALRDVLAAATSSESIPIRSAAIQTLAAFHGSPEARASALAAANGSQDPFILSAAVRALVMLDSTLIFPVLQSAMVTESENDFVRRESIQLLHEVRIDPDQQWQLLENILLGDGHPATRLAALRASGAIFSDADRRMAILARWPVLHEQERLTLARVYTDNMDAESLEAGEQSELGRWSAAEPYGVLSDLLSAFLTGNTQRVR